MLACLTLLYCCVRLVTTDVMARGIDVDGITAVVSYDLPTHVNTYVHRIGRTARAGNPGVAYSIVTRAEVRLIILLLNLLTSC